jgi:hypothetical protein
MKSPYIALARLAAVMPHVPLDKAAATLTECGNDVDRAVTMLLENEFSTVAEAGPVKSADDQHFSRNLGYLSDNSNWTGLEGRLRECTVGTPNDEIEFLAIDNPNQKVEVGTEPVPPLVIALIRGCPNNIIELFIEKGADRDWKQIGSKYGSGLALRAAVFQDPIEGKNKDDEVQRIVKNIQAMFGGMGNKKKKAWARQIRQKVDVDDQYEDNLVRFLHALNLTQADAAEQTTAAGMMEYMTNWAG